MLFGPGTAVQLALDFAAQQRLARPALGVLLLREQFDVDTLGQALRAGVRDVVDGPGHRRGQGGLRAFDGGVAAARGRRLAGRRAAQARVVTVFSAKGGCGKSTMATNLALALAAGGERRVCLVDLDLAFGDVGIMLQLAPERGIADAVSAAERDRRRRSCGRS